MPVKRENPRSSNKEKTILIGSPLEAESFFKSTYWRLSFDFPWNPDPLVPGNDYAIYDEMIDDDQVKSALSIKKDMVINTGWMINGENPEVNDFMSKMFESINKTSDLDSTFDDILRDILSAYDYGFSMSEPIYDVKDGKIILKSIKVRSPHSFRFVVDDKGRIINIIQTSVKNGDVFFDSNTFLHHIYQPHFGNPFGKSDLRSAFNSWKAKKFIERMFAVYLEKFASPTVVGTYPKNATEAEREAFNEMLKTLQHASTMIKPENYTVDFKQLDSDSSDIYLKSLDYHNMRISRSILVPDLIGLGGIATKSGSFALGKEQFKVFLGTIRKDRISLERKITLKLIMPLVKSNFGDFDTWFEFKPYTHDDIIEYLKIWVQAVTGKIYTPSDEEINYFRSATNFPEGDVERPKPPAPMPNPFQPKPEGVPEKKDAEPDDDMEDDIEEDFKLRRELTKYEKKVDFALIDKTLNKIEDKFVRKLNQPTKNIYNSLIKQIRDEKLLTKFDPKKIDELKPMFMKEMNRVVREVYDELFIRAFNSAQKETFPKQEKKFVIDMLPEEFLELLESESFSTVGGYSGLVTKTAKEFVTKGIKDGLGVGELIKLLRDELGIQTEKWLNTVARTKTNELFNEGRKQYWETDEQAKDIVVAYQWSSILDDRTSDICSFLDNKIYRVGEISDVVKPPAHFNCRSILVPITRFEDFEVTPRSQLQPENLQKKGGNLIGVKGQKTFSIDNEPTLKNTLTLNEFGEHILIGRAGRDKFVKILTINVTNMDSWTPVQIAFRGENDNQLQFKTLLDRNITPNFLKEFGELGWRLESNDGFIISLSANVQIEITIEYIIVNKNDKRLM